MHAGHLLLELHGVHGRQFGLLGHLPLLFVLLELL